jgi:hypothetical protein
MDDLGDALVKIATDLIKAGAILPVVGFGCFYFVMWLVEKAHEFADDRPLYWFCFLFAGVLGSVGALALGRFVLLRWRDRPRRAEVCVTWSGTTRALPARPQRRKVVRHADCSVMVVRE